MASSSQIPLALVWCKILYINYSYYCENQASQLKKTQLGALVTLILCPSRTTGNTVAVFRSWVLYTAALPITHSRANFSSSFWHSLSSQPGNQWDVGSSLLLSSDSMLTLMHSKEKFQYPVLFQGCLGISLCNLLAYPLIRFRSKYQMTVW